MSIYVDETYPTDALVQPFAHRQVKFRQQEKISDHYDIGPEIGRGKFGIVYRCTHRPTGLHLAAKFVATSKRSDRQAVEREVDIMNSLQHPGIIRIFDAFDAKNEMALMMELVEGGELFDRVIEDDYVLTERACAVFIRQIFDGVSYIHQQHILHLDLKPENVICTSKRGNQVKIIDFGLARRFDPDKTLQVLFGTPEFVAPEVVNFEAIGFATDIWSIGVITYVLVSGLSPFMGDTDFETMANVTIAKYDFDDEAFDDVTDTCKDFISRILIKDKSVRMTSEEALCHNWLTRMCTPKMSTSPPVDIVGRAQSDHRRSSIDTGSPGGEQSSQLVQKWLTDLEEPNIDAMPSSSGSHEDSLRCLSSSEPLSQCAQSAHASGFEEPADEERSSVSSTDSEVVRGALLRSDNEGGRKIRHPLERVRAASLKREESLKKIRDRLILQASREEHYISLDEVKKLKNKGCLADALLNVSGKHDLRRRSAFMPRTQDAASLHPNSVKSHHPAIVLSPLVPRYTTVKCSMCMPHQKVAPFTITRTEKKPDGATIPTVKIDPGNTGYDSVNWKNDNIECSNVKNIHLERPSSKSDKSRLLVKSEENNVFATTSTFEKEESVALPCAVNSALVKPSNKEVSKTKPTEGVKLGNKIQRASANEIVDFRSIKLRPVRLTVNKSMEKTKNSTLTQLKSVFNKTSSSERLTMNVDETGTARSSMSAARFKRLSPSSRPSTAGKCNTVDPEHSNQALTKNTSPKNAQPPRKNHRQQHNGNSAGRNKAEWSLKYAIIVRCMQTNSVLHIGLKLMTNVQY